MRTLLLGPAAVRRSLLALCAGVAIGSFACAASGDAVPPVVEKPDLTVAAAVGDTEFFDITLDLGVAFCSTAVGCPPNLHGQTLPSLVTGATCSMPNAWDGFLLYARRLACYSGHTGALSADPTTWSGEATVSDAATTAGERAYSAVVAAIDTQYTNSSQYLEPLDATSPSHCFYEAEALIAPTAMDADPRAVYHRQHPARMTWGVVIEPTTGGAFDCHFPALSGIDVDYPASLTVSKLANTTKGSYPATFDYATVQPLTLNDGADFGGARIRYVLGATMPVTPTGIPTWAERNLWISNGTSGIDAVIDSTCVRVDSSTGALVSIGLLLRGASTGNVLGAVEVLSTSGSDRFDCPRETDGSCSYLPYTVEPGGETLCTELITRCHDGTKNFDETDVDCGGSCGRCAVGLTCDTDADCLSGYCTGSPLVCMDATSCLALYTARSSAPNGRYELDPDGSGGADPFLAYCDMSSGDAGWTLVMRLSTTTQNLTFGATAWTTTALLNGANPQPNVDLLNATDAKYDAYNTVGGATLRLDFLAPAGVSWTYALGTGEVTALDVFSGGKNLIVGDESFGPCQGTVLPASSNYDVDLMRFGSGSQFYGFNGTSNFTTEARLRWGFGSNFRKHPSSDADAAWRPQNGIGSPTASIFWTYQQGTCDPCACFGDGNLDLTATAGNLWIK